MPPTVRVEGVTVSYKGEPAVEDATFQLNGPGLVQLLGPNGAGKTTLLRTIAGLVKPDKGRVLVNGVEVTGNPVAAGRWVGIIPQRPPISQVNPMTVYEFVETRLLLKRRWPRLRSGGEVRARVERLLATVGLPREAWGKRLWELSGGMLMRTFIARTLAAEPEILLMDEPLAPVDPAGKVRLARLIVELARERLVIVTSHDPELLLPYTKTIVLVNRRVIASGAPGEVLTAENLRRVYGEGFIESGGHLHILDEHWARGGVR